MTTHLLTRRDFIKANAVAAAAMTAGIPLLGEAADKPAPSSKDALPGVRWDKAACRFCGTG